MKMPFRFPDPRTLNPGLSRLALWLPVLLMAGAGVYFALPREPSPWAGVAAVSGAGTILLITRNNSVNWAAVALLAFALGFGAAQFRAQAVASPTLREEVRFRQVEGMIGDIDVREKGAKLVLSAPRVEGLAEGETPARMRITVRTYNPEWQVGDRVRVKATLMPLPTPSQPGAYDFARYFYFQRIGAVGYAAGVPEVVERAPQSGFSEWLGNLRHRIAEDMRARIGGAEGAIAAAVTVGEMGAIPDEANLAMRDSGLSHILSISGLHLALASGIVFFAARFLLTLWPRFALRLPTKKIAAGVALVSAFAYLLLAGAPVPAQRSFIMVAFVLAAAMIDRKGVSLVSLAWAAALIMLVLPESLLGASFQMSFAATLAIVALYERFGFVKPGAPWWQKPFYVVLAVAATSLAATLATAPFVIYNFNRFSTWGLLANVLTTPLTTFLIMPGVVMTLAGLTWPGYFLLEWGNRGMLAVAAWISSLPWAAFSVPAPPAWGFLLAVFGFLWLCLMRGRARLAGVAIMGFGMGGAVLYTPPDMLVGAGGRQVMAMDERGEYVMLKGSDDSFTAEAWLRAAGRDAARSGKGYCEDNICTVRRGDAVLRFVQKPEALARACAEKSDVLTVWWRVDSCPGAAHLIDRRALEEKGAHAVYVTKAGIRVESVYINGYDRPWNHDRNAP